MRSLGQAPGREVVSVPEAARGKSVPFSLRTPRRATRGTLEGPRRRHPRGQRLSAANGRQAYGPAAVSIMIPVGTRYLGFGFIIYQNMGQAGGMDDPRGSGGRGSVACSFCIGNVLKLGASRVFFVFCYFRTKLIRMISFRSNRPQKKFSSLSTSNETIFEHFGGG